MNMFIKKNLSIQFYLELFCVIFFQRSLTYFLALVTRSVNGFSQQYILMIFMLFSVSVSSEMRSSLFWQTLALFKKNKNSQTSYRNAMTLFIRRILNIPLCSLIKTNLVAQIGALIQGARWCSGYHICLTRRRSRVQSSVEPVLFLYSL